MDSAPALFIDHQRGRTCWPVVRRQDSGLWLADIAVTFWTMSQDHRVLPLPLLILTPTVNVTKFAGHRGREVACRSCPAELLRKAGILRKGSRLFSLMETGGSFALSSAHTPHRRPADTVDHALLWSGLRRSRRRMRSASSPTEHGDLLTPRGVWTCRTPEWLCPLGGQEEGSTCSGIGFFFVFFLIDFPTFLNANSHQKCINLQY